MTMIGSVLDLRLGLDAFLASNQEQMYQRTVEVEGAGLLCKLEDYDCTTAFDDLGAFWYKICNDNDNTTAKYLIKQFSFLLALSCCHEYPRGNLFSLL